MPANFQLHHPMFLPAQGHQLPPGWWYDDASEELVIPGPVRFDGDVFVDGTLQHRGIQQLCSIAFKNVHGLITFNEALTEGGAKGAGRLVGLLAGRCLECGSAFDGTLRSRHGSCSKMQVPLTSAPSLPATLQ